jgi:predicted O-methyltransferase YrrM
MPDSKNILEIGVYYGGSLKYLSDKFKDGNIYGIDIEDKTQYNEDRIKTYIVNQEDRDALNKFLDETNIEFDIIIDDGGHTMKQHQISISVLFKHLKSGGVYVIEDLHTCEIPHYLGEDLKTTKMLRDFQVDGKIRSRHIKIEESIYLEENIESVEIIKTKESEIAVIYKK